MRGSALAIMLAGSLAVGILSGCILVRGDKVEQSSTWPFPQSQAAKSIALSFVGASEDPKAKSQALDVYRKSGLFSQVVLSPERADLRADIAYSGLEGKRTPFLGVLNGITLTLIPDKINYSPTITATFKDSQGNVIQTIQKSEDVSMWLGFFMLFVSPFLDSPGTVSQAVSNDLHRAILAEARAQGAI
jgi:hypothetical protein